MNTEFWLLDLNYELYHGKPTIWLWGITRQQSRVLVIDSYEPYFYILPPNYNETIQLQQVLDKNKPHPLILRTILEKRKNLSLDRQVLKILCQNPESLAKAAKAATKALDASKAYEYDLRPATKYQNDHQIRPCQWYSVDTDPSDLDPSECSVDKTLEAASHPTSIPTENFPELRTLSFSILTLSEAGSPSPARDPIRALAWKLNNGDDGLLEAPRNSDGAVLETFSQTITKHNPDVLFSYGGNTHHWPYIQRRSEKTGKSLQIGRGKVAPHQSLYGHFSITGRANVDLADFAEDLYDVKEKTLQNVAKYLGLKPPLPFFDETEYYSLWSSTSTREKLLDSTRSEAEKILELGTDAIPYVLQLSWLSGLPPDQVLKAAVGFRVDNYMMMEAKKLGQLIPPRAEQPIIPYKGAIVLEPEAGLYENVAALDFSSMYPSLMIKYNVSPDTLIKSGVDGDAFTIPEVGHRFRKKPAGFYPIVLQRLIDTRSFAKKELAKLRKGSTSYRLLKARERATKIITNAVYGYAGWAGSRWYFREVAESAAALGRDTMMESVSIAKKLGLRILYGDTDSLFMENDELRIQEFLQTVNRQLGLEINIGQVYNRILFTESKKKYAGLKSNGELDVVGMEAIRGDWSALAKDVQSQVLRTVLEDKGPSRAVSYVALLAGNLREARLARSSFVIWRALTKRPEDYEVHAPHVEVAKKMTKAGWPVSTGDRVGYIVVKGPGKLYQKAEPYTKVSLEDVDYDYYVQNQVLPVARRILSVFGVTERDIIDDKGGQATL